MKAFLNDVRLDYVLFHLKHHLRITTELRDCFYFARSLEETHELRGRIVFLLSDQDLEISKVIHIEAIAVLFPVLDKRDIFFVDENDNLIFCHDWMKSIFYLLSGYQEYANPDSKDNLQRFSFKDAVQYRLKFIERPVVNYYFEFIIRGIEHHWARRSKTIEKRRLFQNFGFLLTHDIDKIDLYDIYYLGYKVKELLLMRSSRLNASDHLRILVKGILQWLHLTKQDNPYWNFDFLRTAERERNFRSVFFFLDQGLRHSDAYYSFGESRMLSLFQFLISEKCEIGLHGPVKSIDDQRIMQSSLNKLKEASRGTIVGNRQHRLLWKYPQTANTEVACGLQYDCTLGFAAHEGFRNSYCMPFKLFDFDQDRMIDLWEFPLNVMDGTLFAYQNYSTEVAMGKCMEIVKEISRFGGVFDLLWHNSFFDDLTYPGITQFYLQLLENIFVLKPDNVVGLELLTKMNNHDSN